MNISLQYNNPLPLQHEAIAPLSPLYSYSLAMYLAYLALLQRWKQYPGLTRPALPHLCSRLVLEAQTVAYWVRLL